MRAGEVLQELLRQGQLIRQESTGGDSVTFETPEGVAPVRIVVRGFEAGDREVWLTAELSYSLEEVFCEHP